jgi:hypothetical protein
MNGPCGDHVCCESLVELLDSVYMGRMPDGYFFLSLISTSSHLLSTKRNITIIMKTTSFCATALAALNLASAAPLEKRAATLSDGDILNYALTLEHLENKFYGEGLAMFSESQFAAAGYDSTFYENLKEISYDESTHVNFLTTALKGKYNPTLWHSYLLFSSRKRNPSC